MHVIESIFAQIKYIAQISSENGFTITMAGGSAVALTIFWKLAQFVKGIRDDLRDIKKSLWSVTDQERWANKLARKNPRLVIPDTFSVRNTGPDSLSGTDDSRDPFTG